MDREERIRRSNAILVEHMASLVERLQLAVALGAQRDSAEMFAKKHPKKRPGSVAPRSK